VAQRITDLRTGGDGYAALDDRMLVLDFQAGHPEAFVEVHERYGGLVRHICLRYLPNQQDADEAFQETMVRVFQGLYRFNGRYALQPWIARIATNVSLDALRGRARRPNVDGRSLDDHEEYQDPGESPDEAVERLVQRDLVLSVLTDMPEAHRRALVLREMEGRSHREIAKAMDISPAQAKALIHRAKGTFRRRWLEAVAERGGFAAIAFLPLVWLVRVGGAVRRIGEKAVHAVGTTEIVTSTAASSATVAPAATNVGERLVAAAAVTAIVAGGVTVGAAITHRHGDQQVRDSAPAVVRTVEPQAPAVVPVPHRDHHQPKVKGTSGTRQDLAVPIAAAPTPTVDPTPTTDPSASPSTEPSAEPTPPETTPPPVPPAPAWGFTFTSSNESVETCSCDATPELVSSSLNGEVGDDVTFAQTVRGAALDGQGDPAWPFYLDLSGSAGSSGGQIHYGFQLTSLAGIYSYEGSAVLADVVANDDGSYLYRFVGTYQVGPDPRPVAGIPERGFMAASIGVWPDGTIYLGSFALTEAV
jgi:RNA polymerase sigma-70 factor, ECF subfamily